MKSRLIPWICASALTPILAVAQVNPPTPSPAEIRAAHDERPDDPYVAVPRADRVTTPAQRWRRGSHISVQVNVDGAGNNIVNDAANEPSIAVDLTNSQHVAIGWRQFDTITSNFRQAGWGYTDDGGATWTADVINPGVFRSDPVLDSDAGGNFYYNSLRGTFDCDVFRSADGGASWDGGVFAAGGDKQWMAIDRTDGLGAGHIYSNWNQSFSWCSPTSLPRTTNGGDST